MTAIPVTAPVRMGKSKLTLGADDATLPVSGFVAKPTGTPQAWKGIGGNKLYAAVDWQVEITAVQDTGPTGFLRWCLDHYGETVTFSCEPLVGGPALVGSLVVGVPSQIGGNAAATTPDEFTVTCDLTTAPEFDDTPGV